MAKTPRLFGLVALVAVSALLGAALQQRFQHGFAATGQAGGILRIGTTEGIDSLNPFVGFNQDSYSTWFYIYPSLVQYDLHTYKFIPNFATSWQTSPDGLTWTFHLAPEREVVRWEAARGGRRGLDGQHHPEVPERPRPERGGERRPPGQHQGHEPHHGGAPRTSEPVSNALPNLGLIPILPRQVWGQYATGNGSGLKRYPNAPHRRQAAGRRGPLHPGQVHPACQVALFKRNPDVLWDQAPIWTASGCSSSTAPMPWSRPLKGGQLDAIEHLPPTAVAAVKAAGFHVSVGPSLEFRDFIFNSNRASPSTGSC